MPKALWECPHCGAKLVSKNLSHSCGDFSVEKFLAGKSEHALKLFARFEKLIAACGPYHLAPAKTRVAFMSQVRFASVNRLSDASMDIHFVLPRALESSRFRRVERVGKVFVHHLRIRQLKELDRELQRWLRAAYEEYGNRTWLAK